MIKYFGIIGLLITTQNYFSQGCCSGGAGSPLASGNDVGVLAKYQFDVTGNYQRYSSNKFFAGDQDTASLFHNLTSDYLFYKVDYGVNEKLTFSIASGYFLDKSLYETDSTEPQMSKGMGDLIIFPRLNVFSLNSDHHKSEITLGFGAKIPLGSHTDSAVVFEHPVTGYKFYSILPPTVQPTNGSQDLLFSAFLFHRFKNISTNVFSNLFYMHKGFNSLGEKFGDYASASLFVSKSLGKVISLLAQVKYEHITQMKGAENLDLLAFYNIDVHSTGSQKYFFIPQLNLNFKNLTWMINSEIPLYQNMKGVQVGSQFSLTTGLSYRFFVKDQVCDTVCDVPSSRNSFPIEGFSNNPTFPVTSFFVAGNCEMCKTTIENSLKLIDGVRFAEWNVREKSLQVEFDQLKTNPKDIKIAISEAGYDTDETKASNKAYKKLHSCCKYTRK